MSIYFVTAEASGDLLAREVIEAVLRVRPATAVDGIGGSELASIGIQSAIDLTPLSVLGLFEGVKIYRKVIELADAVVDDICLKRPSVVVLVDSWGFMLRVAQRIRARAPSIRLVKLIGPQVWATRPGRAEVLAGTVDHILCIHDIEAPYYEPFGLKVTVIGNPALSRGEAGDGAAFRQTHGIAADLPVILVLPGSRRSEITGVAPVLLVAAKQIKLQRPECRVIVQPAASVLEAFRDRFPDIETWADLHTRPAERYDAMAASTLALACSGTVTSEVAMQGTPMIVGYKTGWITWALARGFLYKKVHITLLNILNDDSEIVPEFVQTRLDADLISAKALGWLEDPELLADQRTRQNQALKALVHEGAPAAEIAAGALIDELNALSGS